FPQNARSPLQGPSRPRRKNPPESQNQRRRRRRRPWRSHRRPCSSYPLVVGAELARPALTVVAVAVRGGRLFFLCPPDRSGRFFLSRRSLARRPRSGGTMAPP